MIRSKDLNLEIKTLEDRIKEGKTTDGDIVKALCLCAKLLRDVRTNQVASLKASGVKLIAPRREGEPRRESEPRKEGEEKA